MRQTLRIAVPESLRWAIVALPAGLDPPIALVRRSEAKRRWQAFDSSAAYRLGVPENELAAGTSNFSAPGARRGQLWRHRSGFAAVILRSPDLSHISGFVRGDFGALGERLSPAAAGISACLPKSGRIL